LIVGKIEQFKKNYPNVDREISNITSNNNSYEVNFVNGSTIVAVPSSENALGKRANYLIVEESRLVKKEILEHVLKPFLFSRTAPYRLLPKYEKDDRLREEGIISYITSAGYKQEYWYQMVKAVIKKVASGDEDSTFLCMDYLVCLKHNIKTPKMLAAEMAENDPVTVSMEYMNIASGESGKAYFPLKLFRRTNKKAFYPFRAEDFGKKKSEIKKQDGEIRFLSFDIATRNAKSNDLSCIGMIRCIPTRRGYIRQLENMETFKGKNTILQALRLKQLFYDFQADWIVMDLQNIGSGVYDSLGVLTRDDGRDIEYPPFTVVGDSFVDEKLRIELKQRTLGTNPIPTIYPILASQSLNSQIASSFRNSLQKKLWEFLVPDNEGEEYLMKNNKDFSSNSDSETDRAFYLNPYTQTTFLINECINLDMILTNGFVKLSEKPGAYKDRYSSVSYCNYVISETFDPKVIRGDIEEESEWDILSSLVMSY
jgi:hypothetical protein